MAWNFNKENFDNFMDSMNEVVNTAGNALQIGVGAYHSIKNGDGEQIGNNFANTWNNTDSITTTINKFLPWGILMLCGGFLLLIFRRK